MASNASTSHFGHAAVTCVVSRARFSGSRHLGGKTCSSCSSGRRFPSKRRSSSRVATLNAVAGLFGRGGSSADVSSLAAIELEIDQASPASSTAGTTQLSLPDAVWKVSREIPASLRDRAAVAVAAEATQAVCETGLDGAGLAVSLAILQALKCNGLIEGFTVGGHERGEAKNNKTIKAMAGYRAGDESSDGKPTATPHVWLELDGKVLDVVTDGLALCEAARRAGVDYSDEESMSNRFGNGVLDIGGYAPHARPPLTVLNVPVPVGGTGTKTVPVRLTLSDPPLSVSGAESSIVTTGRYREALIQCSFSDDALDELVASMPLEVKDVFHRVASVTLDVVGDEKQRSEKLKGL